jgi:excisionase family DNA binding protein
MLTVQRAAKYLSLPVSQIRDLYWSRQLPIIRRGKRIIIDIRDLDAWVEKTKATL